MIDFLENLMPFRILMFAVLLTLGVSGCQIADGDSNPTNHGCTMFSQSSGWSGKPLKLTHTESRNCPATNAYGEDLSPGDPVMTSGKIIQTDLSEEGLEWQHEHADAAFLEMEDYNFNPIVNTGLLPFGWEWISPNYQWNVNLSIAYDAITSYDAGNSATWSDYAFFEVEWDGLANGRSFPNAKMEITYMVDDCSGPGC